MYFHDKNDLISLEHELKVKCATLIVIYSVLKKKKRKIDKRSWTTHS